RALFSPDFEYPQQEQDKYAIDNRLLSCYDRHSDGSGVCYSSFLRPIVNFRPKVVEQDLGDGHGYPHGFNADLHTVDWLIRKGFAFDVATDHDLHAEGLELLGRYRAVVSSTHHEYWTAAMLDALESYLQQGGRF